MRHPTTGLSEDDLSRLTGSSFSPESCSSNGSSSSSSSPSSSTPSPSSTPSHTEQKHQQTTNNGAHVTVTPSRHKDGSLTPTPIPAATKTTTAATCPNYTLDAELLRNLKNSFTHTHAHAYSNANVNGNGNGNRNGNGNGNEHKTKNTNSAGSHFNSSYLPEFIDPLDWQKSRKRKERLDSTSSITQERKLIRSNSEELLTNENECQQQQQYHRCQQQKQVNHDSISSSTTIAASAVVPLKLKPQVDAIRRVASEDFKKIPYSYDSHIEAAADAALSDLAVKDKSNNSVDVNGGDENDASAANRQQQQQLHEPLPPAYSETLVSGPTKDMTRRSRFETSPARSQRLSPNRTGSAKYHRDSDDSECEHERRRSSERFCKSRAPPSRKASGVMKKSGKYLPMKMHGDESAYKYDLSALKYERRGFISKKLNAAERSNGADYNDNNLIDFHIIHNGSESAASMLKKLSPAVSPTTAAAAIAPETSRAASPQRNRKSTTTIDTNSSTNSSHNVTSAEALPWDSGTAFDQTEPMLSRRYATVRHRPSDCIDTAAKLSKVMPYPQKFHKQTSAQLMGDDCLDPLDTFRAFTSLENLKTREVMQQVIPAMMSFQSPEERLKQLNKRLTALKKKLAQFEEVFETKRGYRPSQAEKLNDKYMKNVLAELSKLRKEKHQLKTDPMGALGLKISGGMDDAKKLEKIKATLSEIEQNLSDKRKEANRTADLDELSAEQLLQEKSAVQHGLLYFESLYGRPATKEERDAARPLYNRYRQLKRMVSRSVALSCCAVGGASDLPTILEHEAMVFESVVVQQQQQQQYSSNTSTDNSSSSSSSSNNNNNINVPASDNGDGPNNSNSYSYSSASNTPHACDDSSASTTTATAGDHVDISIIGSNTSNTITMPTNKTNNTSSQPLYGENISTLNIDELWDQLDKTRAEKKLLKRTIREYETVFEEQNGRKMLKNDRKTIEETYAQYKEKKAKARLLQALIKKHISR